MKALSWIAAPLWPLQLASGQKSFRANPLLGSPALNRRGLHIARVRLAENMAAARRQRLGARIDAALRTEYEARGYLVIENFLPGEEFAALKRDLEEAPLRSWERREGSTVTRRGSLDLADIETRAPLERLMAGGRIADLLRYVAGCGGEPLIHLQTILAEGDNSRPDPQNTLHMDTFHSTAKAWLYLQDVGEDDGPLCYVPGSHRLTPERIAWERELSIGAASNEDPEIAAGSFRVSDAMLAKLGYPAAKALCVPANTLVVANTHGFHARKASTRPTRRSEIYGSLRRNPFLPVSGMHLYSLPGLRGHLSSRQAQIDELLARYLGVKGPWVSVPPKRIVDTASI
ncbi:phytanoyl-CoA dioxygenase family protein [Parvibaculum sp.]|uniref:phytanoyl-CoA dioxygenase family protein n=1 Tax=Parvibaculum sp. TaxID=2024848 RepID=UPI003BACAF55